MALPLRVGLLALLLVGAGPISANAHGARVEPGHEHISKKRLPKRVWVPVLIYHHIKWLKPSDDAIERGLTVLPSEFHAELRYLKLHRYHPITILRAVAALTDGEKLPSKPVAITFDDGYSDMYSYALPMLRHFHFQASFFIIAGLVGKPRYLTWKQIVVMSRRGMDMEAHTMTHPDLTLVPAKQARWELSQSRRLIQQHTHRPVRIMAYPYGSYNPAILRAVHRAGYIAAFTTKQGWWLHRGTLLTEPRVYIDLDDTVPIFAGRLAANPSVLAEDPT
ncbi:MAG: polysaccharide deacetylase family protein [Chloroflexota bacterium]